MVMFKIPVEYNEGNVVPALETILETVSLRRKEKWLYLKFLWSQMEVMLLLPGNSNGDCYKQYGRLSLSGKEKWSCLKFLWSIMEVMLFRL